MIITKQTLDTAVELGLHKQSIDLSDELYSLFLLYDDYANNEKLQSTIMKTMNMKHKKELQGMLKYPYRIDVISKMDNGDRVDIGPYIRLQEYYNNGGDFLDDLKKIDGLIEGDEARMLMFFIESCEGSLQCEYDMVNEGGDIYIEIDCSDPVSSDEIHGALKIFAVKKQGSGVLQDNNMLEDLFSLV